MNVWKLYYADGTVVQGKNRVRWDKAPVTGVQFLAVKLDSGDGPSRVGWYQTDGARGIWGDLAFYAWLPCDAKPSGVTPDAVLDFWAQAHGVTDVRVADLSLDDLASIGVKCGRSVSDEQFAAILKAAQDDPEIP